MRAVRQRICDDLRRLRQKPMSSPGLQQSFQPAHLKEKKQPQVWHTITIQIAKLDTERKNKPT
jgi:hypothetical protein